MGYNRSGNRRKARLRRRKRDETRLLARQPEGGEGKATGAAKRQAAK